MAETPGNDVKGYLYALNRNAKFVFEPPGRKSALLGPKVAFFATKRIFAPSVLFSEKVTLASKRWFWVIWVDLPSIWIRD